MIRHIVFFTAKKPEDIDTIYRALKTLEAIEGPKRLEVRKNSKIDHIENHIDVVVYGEFPNEEAIEQYKNDPIYHLSTDTVRPLRDMRFAADIKSEE